MPNRLSTVRLACGIAAKHLSLDAGLSEGVVRSIEEGNNWPLIETVERLAAALGVSPCWLAFGVEGDRVFGRTTRTQMGPVGPLPIAGGLPFRALYLGGGQRLRDVRRARLLSLRDLEHAAVVSFATIRKWEVGDRVPNVDTCERLAVALQVAPGWLAYGIGQGPHVH